MNNKIIIVVVVAAVMVLGGYFLLKSPAYKTPSSNLPTQAPSQETQIPSVPPTQTPVAQETSSVNQNVVTYIDTGYSPGTLRVKAGTIITFKNESSQSMWTASAVHPTHGSYPTTGGCIGSTFDTCTGIQPDGSWSFKFDVVGTWKYHNHLSPSNTGTIAVE